MKFDTMFKGYNRYQVDDTISALNEELEQLKKEVDAYKRQCEEDAKKISMLEEKLDIATRDIEIKEKAADEMAQIALREANEIISSANHNADAIVKEALVNARDILVSISKLGIEAKEIKENLSAQMGTLNEVINDFDVPPIPSINLMKQCDE